MGIHQFIDTWMNSLVAQRPSILPVHPQPRRSRWLLLHTIIGSLKYPLGLVSYLFPINVDFLLDFFSSNWCGLSDGDTTLHFFAVISFDTGCFVEASMALVICSKLAFCRRCKSFGWSLNGCFGTIELPPTQDIVDLPADIATMISYINYECHLSASNDSEQTSTSLERKTKNEIAWFFNKRQLCFSEKRMVSMQFETLTVQRSTMVRPTSSFRPVTPNRYADTTRSLPMRETSRASGAS